MLNPHTADVSADQSAFFCISKPCQLELLKLNRSSLRDNDNSSSSNSSLSNNTSSINNSSLVVSPASSTVKITDPSLLVRSSFIVANDIVPSSVSEKQTISKNEHESIEGESPGKNPNSSQENKENSVPSNRVSDETEKDAIITTNNVNAEEIVSPHHPDPPQQPPIPSVADNVRSNWLRDQIQAVEEPKAMENEVVVKDEEEVSPMDTSQSSVSLVVGEEEEQGTVTKSDGDDSNGNDIPKIICSGVSGSDDGGCAFEKTENVPQIENENVSSSSVSLKFKLSEPSDEEKEDHHQHHSLRENENVGDSGISGISSIENNVKAEPETDRDDDELKSSEPSMDTIIPALEEKTKPSSIARHSEGPAGEEEVSRDDEEITGKEEQAAQEEPVPSALQAQSSNADIDNTLKNPFEEETPQSVAKEEHHDKSQTKVDCDVVVVLTEEPEEKKTSATTEDENAKKSAEELDQEVSPEAEVTSPPQSKTNGLTPTPRKKKRAPQPSPQLMQQQQANRTPSTPESVRPMPSPRTRSKRFSTSTTPVAPSLSHANSSASLKQEEYPAELNPFGDEDESEDVPPQPTPKPRPKCTLTYEVEDNPFEKDDKKVNEPEVNNNADKSGDEENGPTHTLPPNPTPRTSTPTPNLAKPYNPFEDDDNCDIGEYEDDKPAGIFARRNHDDTSSISSKTSDLSNTSGIASAGSHLQKSFNSHASVGLSDIKSLSGSTRGRPRKNRRAPLPPGMTSQQQPLSQNPAEEVQSGGSGTSSPTPKKIIPVSPELKVIKNQVNAKVQYRKKRRAPPPRRRVEPLPEEQIKTEMRDLEIKQKELERQGISLEGTIREQMASHSEASQVH